nr:hypothetical protein [Tanacetum cinerariifolium]
MFMVTPLRIHKEAEKQPIPPVPVAPAGQKVAPEILAAHSAWVKGSKEIDGLMLMTMEPEIQRNLEPLHAHEMLKELKTLLSQQAEQELLQTTRDFHSCRQEEGQSLSSYFLKMKGYIDNLERLGHPVTLGLTVSLILIGLRKEYDGDRIMGKGKNKQAYTPKPKIPPPPKRENPAKESICHECGEIRHWKRNCPQYLAELMKKKKKNTTSRAGGSEQELLQATRDFHSCRQEEGQSVYVLKMKSYIDNLERLGHPVSLGLGVSLILIGLRKEYDGFVQNYNMHGMGKTVNELHAMLKLHEQTMPKSNAPALNAIRAGKEKFAPKPKIPHPPKREIPQRTICHECEEIGHWKRNCPQYLAELMKKKKNTTSGAGGSGSKG